VANLKNGYSSGLAANNPNSVGQCRLTAASAVSLAIRLLRHHIAFAWSKE
jgi:hypothetical protein